MGTQDQACCDTFSGYLTLVHHRSDQVALGLIEEIRIGRIPGITYQIDMASTLRRRGVTVPKGFLFQIHRIIVENGEELWGANQLWSAYNNRLVEDLAHHKISMRDVQEWTSPDNHLLITPDSAISHNGVSQPVVQMDARTLTQYDQILGLPYRLSSGRGITVAAIDSGLDPNSGISADPGSRNFCDDGAAANITDRLGHGTAVANVIKHVAPDAAVLVLKVGDRDPVSEWNVLAAVLAAVDSHIINMSLGFTLGFRDCPTCGRSQTESSRSAIFERVISEVRRLRPEAIIVAAAGNRGTPMLDYPSRFAEIVAVGAVDIRRSRSVYGAQSSSNWGMATNKATAHGLVFFAPGGAAGEYVVSTNIAGKITEWNGTSFAAPFASGLFALYLSDQGVPHDRASVLRHFQDQASRKGALLGLPPAHYGNGIISIA